MVSNISESIATLEKAIDDSTKNLEAPFLHTINQLELAKEFLTEKTQKALSNKSTALIHKDDTGTYVCIFLNVTTKTKEIREGIRAISEALNILADNDLIHSCLAPPASLNMAKVALQADTSTSFCFVLVPEDKKQQAEELSKCSVQDGQIGNPLHSLEVELDEGEFLANISITNRGFISHVGNEKELLDREIESYLNILPKGTEVVEIVPCAIYSLCIPYEVRFRNPLMKDYKEVRLVSQRQAIKIDDKVECFNLLTGVEYIRKNGK